MLLYIFIFRLILFFCVFFGFGATNCNLTKKYRTDAQNIFIGVYSCKSIAMVPILISGSFCAFLRLQRKFRFIQAVIGWIVGVVASIVALVCTSFTIIAALFGVYYPWRWPFGNVSTPGFEGAPHLWNDLYQWLLSSNSSRDRCIRLCCINYCLNVSAIDSNSNNNNFDSQMADYLRKQLRKDCFQSVGFEDLLQF